MGHVDIDPDWRSFLEMHELRRPEDFLRLPGEIICGHPDRNVSRVTIGCGHSAITAFLKKEHRVRWRDRIANAWAGYGFCSKSRREMAVYRQLRETGVPIPEIIAAGEQDGKAFALISALDGAQDLYAALHRASGTERRRLGQELGKALAGIHAAGLDHPDLYSKHILVKAEQGSYRFWFLDWQRSRRRDSVSGNVRCRDLAALDATLPAELVADAERLACLRAYLRAAEPDERRGRGLVRLMGTRTRQHANRLLRHRYVRELRHAPLRPQLQRLIWLDGEATCVTPEFHAEIGAKLPAWRSRLREPLTDTGVERRTIPLTESRAAFLVRRRQTRFCARFWNWLRGKRYTSPELEQAGTLFRLQRHGVPSARLLAVGQRDRRRWLTESFLLTEPVPGQLDLVDWLAQGPDPEQRRAVHGQGREILQRLHQAGYYLNSIVNPGCIFSVQLDDNERPQLWLSSTEGLRRSRRARPRWAERDYRRLNALFTFRARQIL